MLYDLGSMFLASRLPAFFAVFACVLLVFVGSCILLAIGVRIGNLIIGW